MEYYVDTLIDEYAYHRVHKGGCGYLPKDKRRLFLGKFDNHFSATYVAQMYFFPKVKACPNCCNT